MASFTEEVTPELAILLVEKKDVWEDSPGRQTSMCGGIGCGVLTTSGILKVTLESSSARYLISH